MQSHLFLQRLLGDAEYLGRHCRHCRDCRQLAALDQPDRFRLPASGFYSSVYLARRFDSLLSLS